MEDLIKKELEPRAVVLIPCQGSIELSNPRNHIYDLKIKGDRSNEWVTLEEAEQRYPE